MQLDTDWNCRVKKDDLKKSHIGMEIFCGKKKKLINSARLMETVADPPPDIPPCMLEDITYNRYSDRICYMICYKSSRWNPVLRFLPGDPEGTRC